jgi:AraC-like DNA-binding protein
MAYFLKKLVCTNKDIFATEFGHSAHSAPKSVGPWSRDIYILHFVIRGRCEFSGFCAEEGQAFLISKGLRHAFTVLPEYEHFWIGFDGERVDEILCRFGLSGAPHQLFFVADADFAKTLFYKALAALRREDHEASESIAKAALMAMLPLLAKTSQPAVRSQTDYAEQAAHLIRTNYVHPIKMAEIAREIHISEKYMYRLFWQAYKISPQKYLLKTRMDAAKNLLTQTELGIQEVAASVGYTSFPSFSRTFSAYFGQSPTAFRRSAKMQR